MSKRDENDGFVDRRPKMGRAMNGKEEKRRESSSRRRSSWRGRKEAERPW